MCSCFLTLCERTTVTKTRNNTKFIENIGRCYLKYKRLVTWRLLAYNVCEFLPKKKIMIAKAYIRD